MLAMPCTTVQKMIGAITILIAAMKASPSGFIWAPTDGIEVTEQDADDDGDEHLDVKVTPERPVLSRSFRGGRVSHKVLPSWSVATSPLAARLKAESNEPASCQTRTCPALMRRPLPETGTPPVWLQLPG